jgi:hypothetical protein
MCVLSLYGVCMYQLEYMYQCIRINPTVIGKYVFQCMTVSAYKYTSGFWPSVCGARTLRAPVFLGSLTRQK